MPTKILFCLVAGCLGTLASSGAEDSGPSAGRPITADTSVADAAWTDVNAPLDGISTNYKGYDEAARKWGDDSPDTDRWMETMLRQRRDRGMRFWHDFPDDPRRFVWFWQTAYVDGEPFYWRDIREGARAYLDRAHALAGSMPAIDLVARQNWRRNYVAYRAAFLSACCDPIWIGRFKAMPDLHWKRIMAHYANRLDLVKRSLEITEFHRHFEQRHVEVSFHSPPEYSLPDLEITALDCAADIPPGTDQGGDTRLVGDFFVGQPGSDYCFEGDPAAEQKFIEALKASPVTGIRKFGEGMGRVADLRKNPMDFQAVGLDDRPVDLRSFRGKVVFVDIWSLGCGSCISTMPEIRKLYDRYRDQGFEVVGICNTYGVKQWDDKELARKVLREHGANWTNCFVSGEADKELNEKYAVIFSPTTFLLDRNGHLVRFCREHIADLESDIRGLLGLPALEGPMRKD